MNGGRLVAFQTNRDVIVIISGVASWGQGPYFLKEAEKAYVLDGRGGYLFAELFAYCCSFDGEFFVDVN